MKPGGALTLMIVLGGWPSLVVAQTAPAARSPQIRARQAIATLEAALETAVGLGARTLSQHVQASATPEAVLLTGQSRARGFRLDGYGIVFDVEFPSIRRSVAWTMRTLQRPDPELLEAMKELRKNTEGLADDRSRREMDRAIRQLEEQLDAHRSRSSIVSTAGVSGSDVRLAPTAVDDLGRFYERELTNALVNAMLDAGADIGVSAGEWLAVCARESLDLRFIPDEPAATLMLRVKGGDLMELRDRRLSRAEVRKRIEVKQY